MPVVQQELFERDWQSEFIDIKIKAMPRKPIINVAEAAVWMNKDNKAVIKLCEAGELDAVNTSPGERRWYEISTTSIINFYKRRLGQ